MLPMQLEQMVLLQAAPRSMYLSLPCFSVTSFSESYSSAAGGPRVCILGGGFGGLYTAVKLESLLWSKGKKPRVSKCRWWGAVVKGSLIEARWLEVGYFGQSYGSRGSKSEFVTAHCSEEQHVELGAAAYGPGGVRMSNSMWNGFCSTSLFFVTS